jgi:hypothetical protein
MNKREFERELFLAMDGFFGGMEWRSKDGRSYQWVMDDLAINTTPEQWLIVDETINSLYYVDYITGEVPCSTPVSPNKWIVDYETPPSTPDQMGWWFCVEDMIPQQMTAEQAWNYTGPFATEREAFIAEIKQMDERIDALVAELTARKIKAGEYHLP